jgi:signal transduction histidine kinase
MVIRQRVEDGEAAETLARRILLVDRAGGEARILDSRGSRVLSGRGDHGLSELIREHTPDLVVLDLGNEGSEALTHLEELAEQSAATAPPVLALLPGEASEEDHRVLVIDAEAGGAEEAQQDDASEPEGIQQAIERRETRALRAQCARLLAEQEMMRGRLVSTREEERNRIALGIHDDAIQRITAVGIRLDTLTRKQPELAGSDGVVELRRDVDSAIDSLRQLILELRPPSLGRMGLARSLRSYVDHLVQASDSETTFELQVDLAVEPPSDVGLLLYRIAQESLTNVVKHAHATEASVVIECTGDGYQLRVADNGNGFVLDIGTDPEDMESEPGHLGFTGMRERAQGAGGRIRLDSQAEKGTTVEAWLPAPEAAARPATTSTRHTRTGRAS